MLQRHSQTGFTLLEVLVAMVILAVSLLAAIKVATEVTSSAIYLQDKTIAQWVGMNKMAELRLSKGVPVNGRVDGTEEMAGREWSWRIVFKKTPYPALKDIEVEVRPATDSKDEPPTIVLRALIGTV